MLENLAKFIFQFLSTFSDLPPNHPNLLTTLPSDAENLNSIFEASNTSRTLEKYILNAMFDDKNCG